MIPSLKTAGVLSKILKNGKSKAKKEKWLKGYSSN